MLEIIDKKKTHIQTYDKLLRKDNLRHGNFKTVLNNCLIKQFNVKRLNLQ